ncbi:MAG: carboxyl transferase domain-containing protein [Anaerolineae bacterium]
MWRGPPPRSPLSWDPKAQSKSLPPRTEERRRPGGAKTQLADEYREKLANPYIAAQRGYVDDVIEPRDTRARLINGLEVLQNKRDSNPPKKHGNIRYSDLTSPFHNVERGAKRS